MTAAVLFVGRLIAIRELQTGTAVVVEGDRDQVLAARVDPKRTIASTINRPEYRDRDWRWVLLGGTIVRADAL